MHTTFEQKITLDLTVSKIQNVHCSQDDDFSRTLLITLSDNGKPYPIPQSDILCLKISKPDHTFVYIDETDEKHLLKNADGTVSVVLSQQMTSVPGICRAELQIISADGMITSCNFNIIVKKSVLSDTEISSTIESNIVQKMVRHLTDSLNPHNVTKDQVGLGNADNTADIDKNVNSSEKLTTARNINGTSFDGTEDIVTDKWGKSRTLTLSGDVSASAPLDGSSDIDLAVTVRDDSHNHTVSSISDLTATAAELNVLDGLTAATNDLNHTAGVTDNIQTQLDAKSPVESPALTGIPTAPTAAAGTDTAQLATTAFTQRAVSAHNTSDSAHADIRNLISALVTRLNAVADSDDETLDQLSEIVAYIKNNKSLIDSITTAKLNVTDIVDNLTSAAADKPLSAKQGKLLKDLIDALTNLVSGGSYTGDTKDAVTTFTSADVADGAASAWTSVPSLASGEKHSSLLHKISMMFKNVRYLYKMLGMTDISAIGGGTVTGAISKLNTDLLKYTTYTFSAVGMADSYAFGGYLINGSVALPISVTALGVIPLRCESKVTSRRKGILTVNLTSGGTLNFSASVSTGDTYEMTVGIIYIQ